MSQHSVVLSACVLQSAVMITVLLRYEHHIDHTFLQATHYQDQGGVLTVHRGEEEVARFPAGSWDGVYRYAGNRVREPDGGERTAKGLEVELGEADREPGKSDPRRPADPAEEVLAESGLVE